MHIFPVLLIYVLVLACVHGFTHSTTLQNQESHNDFGGHNTRKERNAVDQDTMSYFQALSAYWETRPRELFQAFDGNGDKKVSAEEVKAYYLAKSNHLWRDDDTLLFFDGDGDGELNEEECYNYIKDGDTLNFFKKVDNDMDGFLTRGEMLDALKRWGMSEEVSERRLAEDFSDIDASDDDRWNFAELKEWLSVKGEEEDFIRDDFNALDKDGNGFVSFEEYYLFLNRIGADKRHFLEVFRVFCCDQQDLSFEEYAAFMYGYVKGE